METSARASILMECLLMMSLMCHGFSLCWWMLKYVDALGQLSGLVGCISLTFEIMWTLDGRQTHLKWYCLPQALRYFPFAGHIAPLLWWHPLLAQALPSFPPLWSKFLCLAPPQGPQLNHFEEPSATASTLAPLKCLCSLSWAWPVQTVKSVVLLPLRWGSPVVKASQTVCSHTHLAPVYFECFLFSVWEICTVCIHADLAPVCLKRFLLCFGSLYSLRMCFGVSIR